MVRLEEEEEEEEVGSGKAARGVTVEKDVQIDGDSFSLLGKRKVLSSQASCCCANEGTRDGSLYNCGRKSRFFGLGTTLLEISPSSNYNTRHPQIPPSRPVNV